MKFSNVVFSVAAMAASSSAFTAPKTPSTMTSLKMSDKALDSKSQSMPWLDRPEALDGTYQGDVGFDPLGFAKNKEDLRLYREAEIKHAVSAKYSDGESAETADKHVHTLISYDQFSILS